MGEKEKRSPARSGRGSTRYHLISHAKRTHLKARDVGNVASYGTPSPAPLGSDFKPTAPRTHTNRPLSGSRKSSTTLRHSVLLLNKYNTEKRACQVFFIGKTKRKRKSRRILRYNGNKRAPRLRQKPKRADRRAKHFAGAEGLFFKKDLHLQKKCDILRDAN